MAITPRNGVGFVGALFLLVAVVKFLTGGAWVVWLILGVLMGGVGFISRKGSAN